MRNEDVRAALEGWAGHENPFGCGYARMASDTINVDGMTVQTWYHAELEETSSSSDKYKMYRVEILFDISGDRSEVVRHQISNSKTCYFHEWNLRGELERCS